MDIKKLNEELSKILNEGQIMHLDYEFTLDGNTYRGTGVDIGETIDIESEAKDLEGLKISAICHEFDLTVGYDDKEIEEKLNKADFEYCELDI